MQGWLLITKHPSRGLGWGGLAVAARTAGANKQNSTSPPECTSISCPAQHMICRPQLAMGSQLLGMNA